MPWRDLQAARPLIKTCGRGVLALRTRPKPSVTQIAEPCGVCVSMCRAAVALSLALAPARRVWFAAGRAGSRSGTGNTTTRIIENRPEPRRDRAPGQHFIVPTAHTAEVNNCVCVIFLCLRLRTVRVELSALRVSGCVHYSTRSVSLPSRTTRRTPGGRPEYSSSVKHSRRS